MALPNPTLRVNDRTFELDSDSIELAELRKDVEPWLSAVFQSEHLSLLLGNGFTTAIASLAGCTPPTMETVKFGAKHEDRVALHATDLAASAGRGAPNIEDQIRAALQLIGGLDVLGDDAAGTWREGVSRVLTEFVDQILQSEKAVNDAIASATEAGDAAADDLISFLLSFASRAASRDRLNLFTTNYDRLIEFGCDLIGLRPIDRFVGGLSPRFRASRLEVDMHYNPPGIRGEPRYLEGVIRLTKLHGSVDWRYDNHQLHRLALPFGTGDAEDSLANTAFDSLIIYPNPAKDLETLEYPYAELFRDFAAGICRPNSSLVTYGYGFGDDHINRVIADMLTIPSTHLVIISYDDPGGRIESFLKRVGRESQLSLIVGSTLANLSTLVRYFLPKPAIDYVTIRRAELLRRRATDGPPSGFSGEGAMT